MKLTASVFVVVLAASTLLAQTGPVSPAPARPAGKAPGKTAVHTARPVVHRAVELHRRAPVRHVAQAKAPAHKPVRRVEHKPVRRVERKPVRRVERKPVHRVERKPVRRAETKPVEAKKKAPSPEAEGAAGRRDPFRSPVVETGGVMVGCTTGGKKCLVASQITLQGIVQAPGGNIAVIANSEKRTYFLHDNDPVFNGYVLKITSDSVIFKENIKDRLGRPVTREVVKTLNNPAVS